MHTDQEDLIVEEHLGQMSVLMSRDCFSSAQFDIMICVKLADILDLDVNTLFTFISHSPETIELLMKAYSIPEIDVGRDQDPDSLRVQDHSARLGQFPIRSPAVAVDAQPDSEEIQLKDGLDLILKTSRHSLDSDSVFPSQADREGLPVEHRLLPPETDASDTYVERASAMGVYIPNVNGILGEFFVSPGCNKALQQVECLHGNYSGVLPLVWAP